MIGTLLRTQLQFIRSPKTAIERLENDPHAAFVGFRQVLYLAVLWEVAILLWALGGATVTMPAFLKIPEDRYYFYQLIFFIPMFFVAWLLAGSVAYVLSKALGGRGSFDTVLGGFGIAAPISGYFALIPDLVQGILWSTNLVPFSEYQELTSRGLLAVLVWGYMLAYVIAYLYFYSATIRHSHKLSTLKAFIAAFAAYTVSAGIFIVIAR